MAFEDKTLQCVDCNEQFVFSASEQDFFAQKRLTSDPKRCKPCRKNSRKRKQNKRSPYAGEYRSPAFSNSEFNRGGGTSGARSGQGNRNQGEYRSPSGHQSQNFEGEYRSPAFREYEAMDNADDYRSPAFKEYEGIKPEEEYRSPAFREYENIRPQDEYRSPAFGREQRRGRKSERPMFEIVCVACDQKAMVPFVPEEKEDPMCQDCYKEHKELLRKEKKETMAAEAAEAAKAAEDAKIAEAEQEALPVEENQTEPPAQSGDSNE